MSHERILIGQFIKRRAVDPDDSGDPFSSGGQIVVGKDLLDIIVPDEIADVEYARTHPRFPSALQPSLPITLSSPPGPLVLPPPLSTPGSIPAMSAPPLSSPSVVPFEPAPPPSSPASLLFEPAPPLRTPDVLGFQPAPAPSSPSILPFEPAPPPAESTKLKRKFGDFGGEHLGKDPIIPAGPKPRDPPKPPIKLDDPPRAHPPFDPTSIGDPVKSHPPTDPSDVPPPRPRVPLDPFQVPKDVGDSINDASSHPLSSGGQIDPAQDLLGRLRSSDVKIRDFIDSIDAPGSPFDLAHPTRGPVTSVKGQLLESPGSQRWNPRLAARHLVQLGDSLGKDGIARFAATQLGLFLLNRHGKIWNPLTFAPLPIVGDFIPAAADVLTGTPRALTGYDDTNGVPFIESKPGFYERNHGPAGGDGGDIQLQLAKGVYSEFQLLSYPPFFARQVGVGAGGPQNIQNAFFDRMVGAASQDQSLVDDPSRATFGRPLVEEALDKRNWYNAERPYSENSPYNIDELVDAALGGPAANVADLLVTGNSGHKILISSKVPGGLTKLFVNPSLRLAFPAEFRPNHSARAGKLSRVASSPLARSAFPDGIIPAKFPGETANGSHEHSPNESLSDVVNDDEAYLPLSFTDLRPFGNRLRTVFFRPFIMNFSEDFSPEWNEQSYFGRTDPVMGYQGTIRTLSLGFGMYAFGPEDIQTIYQKLNWLASMVYPEYDKDLLYKSGPVIRLRVGDVIRTNGPGGIRGLPGVIKSLGIDYTDSPWELKKNLKVPRVVKISLTMTVLHDVPIGRDSEGHFGGLGIVRDGKFIPPAQLAEGSNTTDPDVILPLSEGPSVNAFRGIGEINADLDAAGRDVSDSDPDSTLPLTEENSDILPPSF